MKTALTVLGLLMVVTTLGMAQPTWAIAPDRTFVSGGTLVETDAGFVPDSETVGRTQNIWITVIYLSNTSASPVTVVIKDRTTGCSGAGCQLIPTVTIAANGVFAWTSPSGGTGLRFKSGFTWQASAADAVVGIVKGFVQ